MKYTIHSGLVATALLLMAAPGAHAQTATTAGTSVNNTATVSFKVNDVVQTTEPEGSVDFKVDRRVDLSVAELGDNVTAVTPDEENKALKFTVTNNTNDIIDVALVAAETSGAVFLAGSNPDQTDNKDTGATFTLYADAGNDGIYDPLVDTVALPTGANPGDPQYLDQLGIDETRTVFVVADKMADSVALVNGDVMVVQLTGTAHSAYADSTDTTSTLGTAALGEELDDDTGNADDKDLVQNVFADGEDAETGDPANNGADSAYDAYKVSASTITVTKTFGVVDDPITDGGPNPKAIPGATLVYCITVANGAGGSDATDVTISDPIPTNTKYVPGTLRIVTGEMVADCGAAPDDAIAEGTPLGDANDDADAGDAGAAGAGPFTGPITTKTDLAAGSSTTTMFQVTID